MTDNQASYLRTLAEEVGEPFDDSLTKAQASARIDELRERSPRVRGSGPATRPSQAEGGEEGGGGGGRPPRPSQAEGER
jgi:hypothetical protein